jgi:hypothetical protein
MIGSAVAVDIGHERWVAEDGVALGKKLAIRAEAAVANRKEFADAPPAWLIWIPVLADEQHVHAPVAVKVAGQAIAVSQGGPVRHDALLQVLDPGAIR